MNPIKKAVFTAAGVGFLFTMPMAAEAGPLGKLLKGLSRANSVYEILRDEDGNEIPKWQILSKAELRACMKESDRLDAEKDDIQEEEAYLISAQTDIDAKGEYLEQLENDLDIESEDDIDRYNRYADEFNLLIDAYEARYETYSTRFDTNSEEIDAYNLVCSAKYYYEEDEAELLAEAAE